MADALETVNTMNAKSKRLNVRFVNPVAWSPTDKMSIFSGRVVTKTGYYTYAESVIFGNTDKRKKETDALMKKWTDGSTWALTNVVVKKKNDNYYGGPHGFILNIGAPSLKAAKLTGADADAIPKVVEPPLTVSNVTDMSTPQVVDFHAFVLDVPDSKTVKNKQLLEVTLADAAKKTIPLNFWEEAVDIMPRDAKGKVLYVFNAYLVIEESGGRHITIRKGTTVVIADGGLPKATALLQSGLSDADAADADVSSLSTGGSRRDYKSTPGEDACVADVHASMGNKKNASEVLFDIPSALIALEDPDNLLTQDQKRIYAPISISDFSGTTSATLTEEPALVLSSAIDMNDFVDLASKGSLSFARGLIRVRRAPSKENVLKLTVVAAVPRLFDEVVPRPVHLNDARIIPTILSRVTTSASGKLTVACNGKAFLAAGVLIMAKATREADTVARGDTFAIQNFVKDALASEPTPKVYRAETTSMLARICGQKKKPFT